MTVSESLSPAHLTQLAMCADRLGITQEEALQRAVARLHMALFDESADPSQVDFTKSVEVPTGPDVTVQSLPAVGN